MLVPINDCLLIELVNDLEYIDTPDKQYATKTRGIVAALPFNWSKVEQAVNDLKGKMVYFEDYKDGVKAQENGKEYAFIKLEEVRGFEQTQ